MHTHIYIYTYLFIYLYIFMYLIRYAPQCHDTKWGCPLHFWGVTRPAGPSNGMSLARRFHFLAFPR